MGFLSSIGKAIGAVTGFATANPWLGSALGTGFDFLGGSLNRSAQQEASARNGATQDEYARHGIQMRVADAKAAGIHPLYALNAQTYNASPSHVGDTSFGDSVSRMGQNISRAVDATRTTSQRAQSLSLENAGLQNELLRAQISQIHRANNPPFPGTPMTLDGQGNSSSRDPSTISDVGFAETEQGGLTPIYSDAMKQRVEDSILPEIEWYLRNRLNPWALLGGTGKAPRKGWEWSITKQQYMPRDEKYYGTSFQRSLTKFRK